MKILVSPYQSLIRYSNLNRNSHRVGSWYMKTPGKPFHHPIFRKVQLLMFLLQLNRRLDMVRHLDAVWLVRSSLEPKNSLAFPLRTWRQGKNISVPERPLQRLLRLLEACFSEPERLRLWPRSEKLPQVLQKLQELPPHF